MGRARILHGSDILTAKQGLYRYTMYYWFGFKESPSVNLSVRSRFDCDWVDRLPQAELAAVLQYVVGKDVFMFFLGILLLALWVIGLATSHLMGGFIHVLLVLALTILISRAIHSGGSPRLAEIRAGHSNEIQNSAK
jgi:Family of unknown function (DUF5670)